MKTVRTTTAARQTMLCCGICLIGALLIVPLLKGINVRLGDRGPDPDLLYFSSPSAVNKMAFGYENLLADIYWVRTIQYFGHRDDSGKRLVQFKNLPALLDITTTLDPDLIDAYRTGSTFLSEPALGAGQPEEAIKLLDKGIQAHPTEWRLRYDKGLVYYLYLQDFKAAGNVWLETSRRPESPDWMAQLAAKSLSEGGAVDIARALWQQQYEESTRESLRENARNRLLSLQVAEDLWALEFLLSLHYLENGSFPQRIEDLEPRKGRKVNTADPLGAPYAYNPETGAISLSPNSTVLYLEVPESYKEDFLTKYVE